MEEKEECTGCITKEETGNQKVFGLKKTVDISLTGRMAGRTLKAPATSKSVHEFPKQKKGRITHR